MALKHNLNEEQRLLLKKQLRPLKKSKINHFGTSYMLTQNFLGEEWIQNINAHWPDADAFMAEVPGNYTLPFNAGSYDKMDAKQTAFWKHFNQAIWPVLTGAVAFRLQQELHNVFGELFPRYIEPATPLTLMQADVPYYGHRMHTHFYHAPQWAFTMLIYVDPTDTHSLGTTLHQLKINEAVLDKNSLLLPLKEITNTCMSTLDWFENKEKKRSYNDIDLEYSYGSLLAFVDGPLSFHSVKPHDKNLQARASRKRRILRAHMQINETAFLTQMQKRTGREMDVKTFYRYMREGSEESKLPSDDNYSIIKRMYELSILDRLNTNEPSMAEKLLTMLGKSQTAQPAEFYVEKFLAYCNHLKF